jgi:hypothetical protein
MTESSVSFIYLMGRNPQIQQEAGHLANPGFGEKLFDIGKIAFQQGQTARREIGRQALGGFPDGIVITINSHDPTTLIERVEQGGGVTTAAQRAVDVKSIGSQNESLNNSIAKNRRVILGCVFQYMPRIIARIYISIWILN